MNMPYFTTIHGFKSGYAPFYGDGYQNQNVNIISNAKPNLVAKFAINREGGSGGLSMTPEERQAHVNPGRTSCPVSRRRCSNTRAASRSSDINSCRCGRHRSSCRSTISKSFSRHRT